MKTSLLLAYVAASVMAGASWPAGAQTTNQAAPAAPASRFVPYVPPKSAQAPEFASSSKPPEPAPVQDSGRGEPAASRSSETVTVSEPTRGEPSVQRTVIDDKSTRIDELKVRGQTKRITVTPKNATKLQYEILPDDSSGTGDNTASHTPHGNEGRRVWNVLSF